jgi:hypothetical protein
VSAQLSKSMKIAILSPVAFAVKAEDKDFKVCETNEGNNTHLTQSLTPVNYIIRIVIWAVIIGSLYKRWRRETLSVSVKDTAKQPPGIHSATERIAGKNKMTVKQVLPNQQILAQGGRDFKWSWLIIGIIFAWPAAIVYYLTSKKNLISVTISPKNDSQTSAVSIQAMGRRGKLAANELSSSIE